MLALILGGGTHSGLGSDAFVQLASLPLIATCLTQGFSHRDPHRTFAFGVVTLAVALPLLQLIQLPPSIWTQLPGRSLMVDVYERTSLPLPWLPVSLDPRATLQSVLSLVPAIAVFLATIQLSWRARRTISLICLVIGVISVLLGLAQLMQGPDSTLRFYPITNNQDSVGFFANRNHYAALLYSLIPFSAAWMIGLAGDRRPERSVGVVLCMATYVVLVLGLAMARSRAGVVLGAMATVGCLPLARVVSGRFTARNIWIIVATIAIAVVVGLQFGLNGLISKFGDGVLDDFRVTIGATTIAAARDFLPVGSGLGTFVPVYQMFEAPAALMNAYINHAHNDWLELLLEGGWAAIAIAGLFLAWFCLAGGKTWADIGRSAIDRALGGAATIAIAGLLLQSAVDYPLRTTAITVLFAFCCGLLIDPPPKPVPQNRDGRAEGRGGWLRALRRLRIGRRDRGWNGRSFR